MLGFHLEFAVEFAVVAMMAQIGDVGIGVCEIGDVFAGGKRGTPVLPELVFAFDFAFGLRRGGVAERDAVEVAGLAELGAGVGDVGEEAGVKVHAEFEGKAAFAKGGGAERTGSQVRPDLAFTWSLQYARTVQSLLYQRTIIGYHGCDRAVAEKGLLRRARLEASQNDYDWLGAGIYF